MSIFPENAMRFARRKGNKGLVDSCQRYLYNADSLDAGYGYGYDTYLEGEVLPCLFQPRRTVGTRDMQGESRVMTSEADLYLARDARLQAHDRVKIIRLHGDTVAQPQTFEVVSGPILGKTLLEAELRLVTDGSTS